MEIKSFKKLLHILPKNVSILIRGGHGIGKSEAVKQFAQEIDAICIDQRLSQKEVGDIIGLPLHRQIEYEGGTTKRVTSWAHPEWFEVCTQNRKVILFLDEINRACDEVQQAAFELVLDRSLQGTKVSDKCRIIAAVNEDSNLYKVNDMDPALVDRFFVVDLKPSKDEWLQWAAKEEIHEWILNYIREHGDGEGVLDPPSKIGDTKEVCPSRRSWKRMSDAFKIAEKEGILFEENEEGKRKINLDLFMNISKGFIGQVAASQFFKFVERWEAKEKIVHPIDIIKKYTDERTTVRKKVLAMAPGKVTLLVEGVYRELEKRGTQKDGLGLLRKDKKTCKNVVKFIGDLAPEVCLATWKALHGYENGVDIIRILIDNGAGEIMMGHCNEEVLMSGQIRDMLSSNEEE